MLLLKLFAASGAHHLAPSKGQHPKPPYHPSPPQNVSCTALPIAASTCVCSAVPKRASSWYCQPHPESHSNRTVFAKCSDATELAHAEHSGPAIQPETSPFASSLQVMQSPFATSKGFKPVVPLPTHPIRMSSLPLLLTRAPPCSGAPSGAPPPALQSNLIILSKRSPGTI